MDTAANKSFAVIAVIIGLLTATVPTYLLFQAVTYLFVVPLFLGVLSVSVGLASLREDSSFGPLAACISLVLLIASVAVPYGLLAYYNRSGYPILLVIPDNYRGPVVLVIDKEGVDVPLRGGIYECRIPADGRLLIRDAQPFCQWHSMGAVYAGGKKIPVDYEGNLPSDMIVLHDLGSGIRGRNGTTEEYLDFFVGTKADLKTYEGRR